MNFPPESMHQLAALAKRSAILRANGIPPFTVEVVRQAHESSWMGTEGLSEVAETFAGSKPGDPLGDMVYNWINVQLLAEIQSSFESEGLLVKLPLLPGEQAGLLRSGSDGCVLSEDNYVDDSIYFGESTPDMPILQVLQRQAVIVSQVYARHGMALNWREGKSEAMVVFRGPGSREQSSVLFLQHGGKLQVGDDQLRVVACYKHMGSKSKASSSLSLEVKARAGALMSALKPIRRS
eukprot:2930705-Alexandrium_andersonii.AAC.1